MTYADLIAHWGGMGKAARALGRPIDTLGAWRSRGIPYGAQCEIQIRTGGALLADPPPKGPRRLAKRAVDAALDFYKP